jgi:hypothetical protein
MKKKTTNRRNIDPVSVDTSSIAIIPFHTTYHWLFEEGKPTELSTTDLKQIEIILSDCISEYNSNQKKQFDNITSKSPNQKFQLFDFVIKLENYKRQYVPVIHENGEKEIWINCFCDHWDQDWQKKFIEVEDGGNCYFQLKINLTKKIFYDFMVNGNA